MGRSKGQQQQRQPEGEPLLGGGGANGPYGDHALQPHAISGQSSEASSEVPALSQVL